MKIRVLIFMAALAALAASCAPKTTYVGLYRAQDYQWHKQTNFIKVHWNYSNPDKQTLVAEGFVEPFNPKDGLHTVRLELVGMEEHGAVVNTAEGAPRDTYIEHPLYPYSPFKIVMKLKGGEKDFTIKGSYYHYLVGMKPDFSVKSLDYIPLSADEPY